MSFNKRPGSDAVCYTKPLDSLKNWNDRFFWVDTFSCPASFPWNTSKGVPKDPFPKSSEFNAEHFATLVALPAPFHKYPKPFLCLVGICRYYTLDEDDYPEFLGDNDEEMDLLSFIRTADPTKVKVAERQLVENEPRLLKSIVRHVVSLLPIAPARASSELEASVDKLFDEGASGEGQCIDIQPVVATTDTIVEDVAPLQPRRQRKRKIVVVDASGTSHPPKKLREDYRALGGASTAGKSRSAIQSLFTWAVLNAEARGEHIPTLPFVTSSVSATPEREDKSPADSVTRLNLQTIGALQRFVISSDSSHHSGAIIAEAEVDSIVMSSASAIATVTTVTAAVDANTTADRVHVLPFLFGVGSSSTGRTNSVPGGFFDVSGSDFLIGGIRTVVDPDSDLQKVYVPQWSATNGFGLDDICICREMLDEFAPPIFFAYVRGMDHDQLFTEFNIESLKAQLLLKEAEAAKAIRLRAEVIKFKATEKSLQGEVRVLKDHSATLKREKHELSVKVTDLSAFVKVRELEVTDLDTQVTAIKLQNDNLVDQVHELEISSAWLQEKVAACLNSTKYMSALGAAISKAVEKGMHERLSSGITHGAKGRKLADVAAYNPSAKADYLSALQRLQNVNFSLIAELKSNKDDSVDTIMNLLRLDDALAERMGLTESQPHANQLMVPIHHSLDQRVVGASALSLSLDVSHSRVRKIRENIDSHVSALRGVFVSLSEPLSAVALEGTECTFGSAHDTTTTLSVIFAGTILPISTDDYEVAHADGQGASMWMMKPRLLGTLIFFMMLAKQS
uniref:Transposase (Putative), gypsy type n=1 Tax=Tanacetum cinerariifolium TaxID=118510 RepID=A0A6L2NAJ6_TANCI|nr:transposase (putative), gypsy type [Tanacetum cinerariifolium]